MKKSVGLGAALITIAVLAGYYGLLDNPFLIDDRQTIEESTTIQSVAEAWFPEKNTPVAGRPIPNVTLALDWKRAELDPEPYHQTNVALHLVNAGLVFLLLRLLGAQRRAPEALRERAGILAGWAAAVWAVHPLHVETILYASQRTELCLAGFALATLYASVRAWEDRRWLVGVVVFGVLAALSKESAIVLVPLVLLLDRALESGSFREALVRHRSTYLALLPVLGVTVAVVLSDPRGDSVGWFDVDYLLAQGEVVWHYALLVVWPADLIASYGFLVPGVTTGRVIGLAALGLVTVAALVLLFARPRTGLFGVWVLGWLAPTSSFASIHTEVGAERRMYLPLIALAFLAVWLVVHLARSKQARPVAAVVGVLVIGALVARVRVRAAEYQDLLSLWQKTSVQWPENYALDYDIANLLRLEKKTDEAIASYRIAVEKLPVYKEAHSALGALLFERGDRAEGLQHLERAFELNNENTETINNLAAAYAMSGDLKRAEALFRRYVELHPQHPQGLLGLAKICLMTERKERGVELLRRAAALEGVRGEEAQAAVVEAQQLLGSL